MVLRSFLTGSFSRSRFREIWPLKQKTENMLLATEMDFYRRATRRLELERIRNETVSEIMEVQNTLVDDIRTRRLIWYGHVQRKPEEQLLRKVTEWFPDRRRRRGRSREAGPEE